MGGASGCCWDWIRGAEGKFLEEGWGGEAWQVPLSDPPPRPPPSGPEVRVLLFNSTGDRDPVTLLKLLQVRGQPRGGAGVRRGGGQQADQPSFWLSHPPVLPSSLSLYFFNYKLRLL